MVGLDCEMCETAEGIALTRITVVDRRGKVPLRYAAPTVMTSMHARHCDC